ncbi:tRNA (adenosine(37)-N6)-dimethylallyltransferase MiaA [Aestuariivirga sp.]|uniref:tRNA (adenosine(37)-N6)-dimethylallyltransferase MiaA n=1 Tax=Aestuariivirga sp. TaxID=2650926 RepID=UPI003594775B
MKKRALLIAGPTASGKSALALDLARKWNGVIINADALQVYQPLRILTARPLPEEEAMVPHRLYGHVGAEQSWSVASWLADASREIEAAWEQGLYPIVTGGTGLYFRALERGLAPVPQIPDEVRVRWRSFEGDLHQELWQRDPAMAGRLIATDRQRLVRALEVVEATGRSLLDWQRDGKESAPLEGVEVERIFMEVPRDELYMRAEQRFRQMLNAGALEEARTVMDLDPVLPMMKAIGLPELIAHLKGETTLEETATLATIATRNYIKRQLTWWRGQMGHWREG